MKCPKVLNWSKETVKKPVAHNAEVAVKRRSIDAILALCIIGILKIHVPTNIIKIKDAHKIIPGGH